MNEFWCAQRVLAFVFDQILRLLHPYLPFVTEEIWQTLNDTMQDRSLGSFAPALPSDMLVTAQWPENNDEFYSYTRWDDQRGDAPAFLAMQEVVQALRRIRKRLALDPGSQLEVLVRGGDLVVSNLKKVEHLICVLAGARSLTLGADLKKPAHSAAEVLGGWAQDGEVYVPLEGLIDLDAERRRLEDRIAKERAFLASIEKKLANPSFVERAPAEVVERERARADEVRATIAALEKSLADSA
jgi:valyl-tRNA synthetase